MITLQEAQGGNASFDVVTVKTDDPTVTQLSTADNLVASALPTMRTDSVQLTGDVAAPLLAEAKRRWMESGLLDVKKQGLLDDINLQITDFGGNILAQTDANTITVDIDAAGWNWFVDITPEDDSEFSVWSSDALFADASSDAYGHMDLLTVLQHEIGYVLGFNHEDGGLMDADLQAGQRKLIILPDTRADGAVVQDVTLTTSSGTESEQLLTTDPSRPNEKAKNARIGYFDDVFGSFNYSNSDHDSDKDEDFKIFKLDASHSHSDTNPKPDKHGPFKGGIFAKLFRFVGQDDEDANEDVDTSILIDWRINKK